MKYSPISELRTVVRLPLLPVEAALSAFRCNSLLSAVSTAVSNDQITTALYVASQALHQSLVTGLAPGDTPSERVLRKVLRYLVRMSTRPTPFGLFSAVALVDISGSTTATVDRASARSHTRVDMFVVERLVTEMERDRDTRDDIKLYSTDFVKLRGEIGIVLRNSPHGAALQSQVMKWTALIEVVTTAARDGISVRDLIATLRGHLPIDDKMANDSIDALMDSGLLVSDLRSSLSQFDDAIILKRIESVNTPRATAAQNVRAQIGALDAIPLSRQKVDHYRQIEDAVSGAFGPSPHLFQTHCTIRIDGTVGSNIAKDAAKLARLILLSRSKTSQLSDVVKHLLSRHEGEFLIPLIDLEGDPALESLRRDVPSGHSYTRVGNSKLFRMLALAAKEHREVTLTEADIVSMFSAAEQHEFPSEIEFGFHVAAKSRDHLNRGDYKIIPSAYGGSCGIGKSVGRLLHLMPMHLDSLRAWHARKRNHDALPAEIVFLPNLPRTGNICLSRRVLAHEIQIGVHETSIGTHRLGFDDLCVGVRDETLFLWSKSLARRIMPVRHDNLAALGCGSDIINLLVLLATDGLRTFAGGFSLGDAETLPHTPRLSVDRLVLSPAKWRLTTEDAVNIGTLASWVEKNTLPRLVWFWSEGNYGDQKLLIDLDSHIGLKEICSTLNSGPSGSVRAGTLEEALGLDKSWLVDEYGSHYFPEIIVPLQAAAVRHVSQFTCASESERHGAAGRLTPEDGWLYFKLYCDEAIQDYVLRTLVHSIVAEVRDAFDVTRWFFIRYSDLQSHLRLRFLIMDPEQRRKCSALVWKRLDEALKSGLVHDIVQAAYRPEEERYGGALGVAAAERLFTADSDIALQTLCAYSSRDILTRIAIEQAFHVISTLLHDNIRAWMAITQNTNSGKLSREQRDMVEAISSQILTDVSGGTTIRHRMAPHEPFASEEVLPRFVRAIVHMHFNRYGISRDAEKDALKILRQICSRVYALRRVTPASVMAAL